MQPNYWRLALDCLGVWLQVAVAVALYVLLPSWPTLILAWILIGGAQHACALVMHEGAHFLLVPRRRELNDKLSSYFFAGPIALPFSTYRKLHADHHRFVSTDDDTKELYRRRFRGWRFGWEVFKSLSGIDYFTRVFQVLGHVKKPQKPSRSSKLTPNVGADLMNIARSQLVLFFLFAMLDWRLYFLLWVIPIPTFFQLFGKLRATVEHQPLDSESDKFEGPYFRGTEEAYLRTVEAVGIEKILLSRINFHYHAEHHLWPQICYQYLPLLSQRLKAREDYHGVVYDYSYFRVIAKLWRGE